MIYSSDSLQIRCQIHFPESLPGIRLDFPGALGFLWWWAYRKRGESCSHSRFFPPRIVSSRNTPASIPVCLGLFCVLPYITVTLLLWRFQFRSPSACLRGALLFASSVCGGLPSDHLHGPQMIGKYLTAGGRAGVGVCTTKANCHNLFYMRGWSGFQFIRINMDFCTVWGTVDEVGIILWSCAGTWCGLYSNSTRAVQRYLSQCFSILIPCCLGRNPTGWLVPWSISGYSGKEIRSGSTTINPLPSCHTQDSPSASLSCTGPGSLCT